MLKQSAHTPALLCSFLLSHPLSPFQAAHGSLSEHDLYTGARTGGGDLAGGVPAALAYAPADGSLLVALTADRAVFAFSPATWARALLVPPQEKAPDKRYGQGTLLTLTAAPAGAAVAFYCPPGSAHLRAAPALPGSGGGSEGPPPPWRRRGGAGAPASPHHAPPRRPPGSDLAPGARVKWEGRRPLAGLAAHPSDPGFIFVLGCDGALTGLALPLALGGGGAPSTPPASSSSSSLSAVWTVTLLSPGALPPLATGDPAVDGPGWDGGGLGGGGAPPLVVAPHPSALPIDGAPGGALLAVDVAPPGGAGPGSARGVALLDAPVARGAPALVGSALPAPPPQQGGWTGRPPPPTRRVGFGFVAGGTALVWAGAPADGPPPAADPGCGVTAFAAWEVHAGPEGALLPGQPAVAWCRPRAGSLGGAPHALAPALAAAAAASGRGGGRGGSASTVTAAAGVRAVVLHPTLGFAALQAGRPPPSPAAPPAVARCALSPGDADAAAARLRVPIARLPPQFACAGPPPAAPVHLPLDWWAPPPAPSSPSTTLALPSPVWLADGGWLCRVGGAGGRPVRVCELAPPLSGGGEDGGGGWGAAPAAAPPAAQASLAPRTVLHSPRARAWAIFFDAAPPAAGSGEAGGARAAAFFTLLTARGGGGGGAALPPAAGPPTPTGPPAWAAPGLSGAWVGPGDAALAVLSPSAATVRVYTLAAAAAAAGGAAGAPPPRPARRVDLPPGGAAGALFPGPRWVGLPRTPAGGGRAGPPAVPGAGPPPPPHLAGVLLWQAAAPGGPLLAGDLSEGGRSLTPARSLACAPGELVLVVAWQDLVVGGCAGEADAVAAAVSGGGGSEEGRAAGGPPQPLPPDGAAGRASVVGAVLTTHRLLLVSASLTPLVAVPAATGAGGGGGGTGPALTSVLWAGPALLASDAAGGVWHLGWDGRLRPLASTGAGPPAALVGATPDRLLLVRGRAPPRAVWAATGGVAAGEGAGGQAGGGPSPASVPASARCEVAPRAVPLLGALVLGWATAAARQVLPGGVDRARGALRRLAAAYSGGGGVGPATLAALAAAGFPGEAAALAAASGGPAGLGGTNPLDRAAAAAAAGDWGEAVRAATADARRAAPWGRPGHAPAPPPPPPPPRGSAARARLVSLGRAAAEHGAWGPALALLTAAGEWEQVAALTGAGGGVGGLERLAATATAGAPGAVVAETLAEVLAPAWKRATALGAGGGGAADANGGATPPPAWRVEVGAAAAEPADAMALGGGKDEAQKPAALLTTSAPGAAPPCADAGSTPTSFLPSLDTAALEAWLGAGATPLDGARAIGGGGGGGGEGGGGGGGQSTDWARPSPDPRSARGLGDPTDGGESAAQAAARAAWADGFGAGGDSGRIGGGGGAVSPGFADDDSDDETTASGATPAAAAAAGGGGGGGGFRLVIRDAAAPGAGNAPADVEALRAAAAGLTLAAPPGGGGGGGGRGGVWAPPPAAAFSAGGWGAATPAAAQLPPAFARPPGGPPVRAPMPADLFGVEAPPPRAPAGSPPPPPPPPRAAGAPPPPAPTSPTARPPPPPTTAAASRADAAARSAAGTARLEAGDWAGAVRHFGAALAAARAGGDAAGAARAAAYAAAARLLAAAAAARDAKAAARLARHAAALGPALAPAHADALVKSAATRNMKANNYGVAGELWLRLVATATAGGADSAPADALAELQARLDECDAAGGADAAVPAGEDTAGFAGVVGAAESEDDVREAVEDLVRG